jgi:protein required for attachment to host cells
MTAAKVWVVVADERDALVFEAARANEPLRSVTQIENPAAQLADRELESDRPGRGFSSATGHRHALGGERSSQRHSQTDFAKRIADLVEQARHSHKFDRLVLLAGPRMLGLMRDALSSTTRAQIVAEAAKDLVHSDPAAIRQQVPNEAFHAPSP